MRGRVRARVMVAALGWWACATGEARAEPARDPVAAEALFQDAKELLRQGAWAEGCARLEASMALDPSVSVLFKIARCREHEGKLAQALSLYQRALSMNLEVNRERPARRDELAHYGAAAVAALGPRVPRLTVAVIEPPEGLTLERDGQVLPLADLGHPLPVDPGEHEIWARAPGRVEQRLSVRLEEGQSFEARLALPLADPPRPRPVEPPSPVPAASGGGRDDTARKHGPSAAWGVGLSAAGALSLGGAAYLGVRTLSKVREASPYCDAGYACTPGGKQLIDEAGRDQTRAFVLLGAGAALAGAGAYMIARSVPAESTDITIAAGPSGVSISGLW